MIDRRKFVAMVAGSAVMVSVPARAQQSGKTWRLAYLSYGSAPAPGKPDPEDAFWVRLRELGYVEGKNLVVERRYADGKTERLPELAAELVRLNPDVIATRAVPASQAAKAATSTIPIVMATGIDPVREGIVASYAKPGGNVTGMMFGAGTAIITQRLQLLKEVVPSLSRLAFVPGIPGPAADNWLKDFGEVAPPLGVKVQAVWVKEPSNWNDAFAEMVGGQAQAVYTVESPTYIANAKHIADLAIKHRMPTMFGAREHVEAGGLISYGVNIPAVFRRAAEIVDKVLKGAKPADLPIETPPKHELVVNLMTAKAIGVTVPSSLLAKADTVIQ
jgi:putative ABC transport system substrate-binding protein